MKLRRIYLVLIFLVFVGFVELYAQCPMCRLSAESNLQAGGNAGKGLNTGILFLLALPYAIIGTLGYMFYKKYKASQKAILE